MFSKFFVVITILLLMLKNNEMPVKMCEGRIVVERVTVGCEGTNRQLESFALCKHVAHVN